MADELKRGALLRNGTYRIEEKLGQGGFGITYLARDLSLDRPVAVKEFFLENCCGREDSTGSVTTAGTQARETFSRYKVKFLKEARNIAKLNHPGIIKIYAAFEENGTAYYVMEYINGMSLYGMVRKGGSLSAFRALEYIKGVGEALSYIHARSMTHLDVKPANIMVRSEDNSPILIDFGLSKQYDSEGQQTSTTPPGISHGYAPLEQYIAGGVSKFSPQTDIYSLAATLYYLLSGETPQQASQLVQEGLHFPASIPTTLRAAIATAMSANIAQRHPNVTEFISALTEDQVTAILSDSQSASNPKPQPTPDDSTVIGLESECVNRKSNRQNKYLLSIATLCVVLLVYTPIGLYLQIKAIEIYDGWTFGLWGRTIRLVKYIITYFPVLAYIVSLFAAIMGFRVKTKEERKGTTILALIAGGVMIVYGALVLLNPIIPIVLFIILIVIGLVLWFKNKF